MEETAQPAQQGTIPAPPTRRQSLGAWLNELAISPGDLATRIGKRADAVAHMAAGRRAPRMPTRQRIAETLGLPPSAILWPDDPTLYAPRHRPGWPAGRPRGSTRTKQPKKRIEKHTTPPSA